MVSLPHNNNTTSTIRHLLIGQDDNTPHPLRWINFLQQPISRNLHKAGTHDENEGGLLHREGGLLHRDCTINSMVEGHWLCTIPRDN